MNYVIIVLGIIIVFLLYYMYIWLLTPPVIKRTAKLNETNPPIAYLKDPTSLHYSYGVFLYVNSWDNTKEKVIISRDKNFTLYLDATTPTLYCKMYLDDDTTQLITITNNFPLQKWVYIVLSVDSQIIDVYLNGKLVLSQKLTKNPKMPGDATVPLLLGGADIWDASVADLIRIPRPMSPQEVINNYVSSYNNIIGGMFSMSSYNANLKVLKNGEIFADTQLF